MTKDSLKRFIRHVLLWTLFGFILLLPCITATLDSYVLINSPGQSGNTTFYNATSNTTRTVSNTTTTPLAYKIEANPDNGRYLIIMTDGWVWVSNDSGNTLRNISVNVAFDSFDSNEFDKICMSDDGRYQYFSYLSNIGNLRVYKSSNYGTTWNYTDISVAAINDAGSIGCSANGQFVVVNFAVASTTNYVRGSSDYGNTFTYYSNTESGFGSIAYEWFIDNSGVEIISNRHIYNTATAVITNYSKSILSHHIYYDHTNGAIIALSSTCSGYFIDGNIALNSSYTAITDFSASTQCYSINSEPHMTSIYAMAGNTMYYTGDYGQSWTMIRSFPDGAKYSFGLETFGSTQVSNITPQCISENTYCLNPYIVYGEVVCQQNDTVYCNAGCTGSTCSNTITNECNILGSRKCTSTTQYAVCSDSNSDSALDYGELHDCAVGTYCVGSFNYANCENVTQSGTHEVYGLSVNPYAVNNENVTYVVDTTTRTVAVNTVYSVHTQKFYTTGTNYIARTCDYKEQSVYSNLQSLYTNGTSLQYTLPGAIAQDAIVRISILPNETTNGTIYIKSQAGSSDATIVYARNTTAKSMCLYLLNGTTIYCDYSTYGADDLTSLDLEFSYVFAPGVYTMKMTFNRQVDNTVTTYPQLFAGNDIFTINVTSDATTVLSVTVNNPTSYGSFTSNLNGTVNTLPCTYTGTGTRIVRTYGNMNGQPDYSVYSDYRVNVKNLGLSPGQLDNGASNVGNFLDPANLTPGTRYFVVIVTVLAIIIGFITAGMAITKGEGVKPYAITGMIIAMAALIGFSIGEWIPGWVAFALIVVALAIIIFMGFVKSGE